MKSNSTNTNNDAELMRQIPVDRKKVILAASLLAIMALMWVRVLVKSRTTEAGAAITETSMQVSQTAQSESETKVSYVRLSVVPGRNDRLVRDIFTIRSRSAFGWYDGTGREESSIVTEPDSDHNIDVDNIRKIARDLSVDAILIGQAGQSSEAFIEDKFVTAGSKLAVKYEDKIYTFTVTEIQSNKVILECRNVTIAVKMPQPMLTD